MAAPTWTEVTTQISNLAKIADVIRTDGQTSVITHLDTYVQSLEGDAAPSAAAGAAAVRASYAAAISATAGPARSHLSDLAKAIDSSAPPGSETFWYDLNKYMIDNSLTVNARTFTRGAIADGGSNVGDGVIYRLTLDKDTMPIEATYADVVTFECVADQNSGQAVGQELFRVSTGAPEIDRIVEAGAPFRGSMIGHSGDEILRNASFQRLTGTVSAPTTIPNWTSSLTVNGTNYDYDSTNFFRASPEEQRLGTSYGLNIKATGTLTQKLSTLRQRLSTNTPYVLMLRYNRAVNSAAGTLVLRLGSQSVSVVLAAQAGWNTLILPVDQNLWLDNFNEDDLDVQIDWTETGGTGLLLDDVLFGAMSSFDNVWYFLAGGATDWLLNDTHSFTDSISTDSVNQAWFWRWFNRYLPSAAAAETWTDA